MRIENLTKRLPALWLVALLMMIGVGAAWAGSGDSENFRMNMADLSPVQDQDGMLKAHVLGDCYPNPFNPATNISYSLSEDATVHLAVYDLTGRRVRTLIDGVATESGDHSVPWLGRDGSDRPVAAGVYLVRMKVGEYSATRRMTLVK